MWVFSQLTVMDMIDTLVLKIINRTIELGQDQDITEISTVLMYLMDNSINGTSSFLME